MTIMIQTLLNTVPSRLLIVHDDFDSSAMAVGHDFLKIYIEGAIYCFVFT